MDTHFAQSFSAHAVSVSLSTQSRVIISQLFDGEGAMGRWKNTPPRDILWTAAKVSEVAEQSAKRATLDCIEQAMACARSYEAADNLHAAEVLRKFAEGLVR